MKTFDIIAGARPNFMKIAPIIHAIHAYNKHNQNQLKYRLIHTGQHYDALMSESFFNQLNIPKPTLNLGAGSGSQAEQTAAIMIGYEKALHEWRPELCIVVGDVTSTMACAIVAKKEGIKVAHVEGGIRSGDMFMPEEINRIVTDSITDYFFTTSQYANKNLINQGISGDRIFFVGNTMIDSLLKNLERLQQPSIYNELHLSKGGYLVATLHRPSNVDDPLNLAKILTIIDTNCGSKKVVLPMHPRTSKIYKNLDVDFSNIYVCSPMPYLEFIYMIRNACGIITDSGGITEEATVLGIPCMTLRDSTERPETVNIGTNEMVGTNPDKIGFFLEKMVNGQWKQGNIPHLWDGKTSERIIEIFSNLTF